MTTETKRRLICVGVSVEGAPFAVVSCNVEIPTQSGVGAASAHVGAAGFDALPADAQVACLYEQVNMEFDIHLFEAWLRWLAKSDPNYALWLADGSPNIPDGAFSGDFSNVMPAEDREGYVGK